MYSTLQLLFNSSPHFAQFYDIKRLDFISVDFVLYNSLQWWAPKIDLPNYRLAPNLPYTICYILAQQKFYVRK